MYVTSCEPPYPQVKSSAALLEHASGLVCLDATHGTNDSQHQLYSLLCITDNRTGLVAAQFMVPAAHDSRHIVTALNWVKRRYKWSPTAFMVDDDQTGWVCVGVQRLISCCTDCCVLNAPTEFQAIAEVFPDAMILLCVFHVARNIKGQVRSAIGAPAAEKLNFLLEEMSRLTTSPQDRERFYACIGAVYEVVFEGGKAALRKEYQLSSVVAAIRGTDLCCVYARGVVYYMCIVGRVCVAVWVSKHVS